MKFTINTYKNDDKNKNIYSTSADIPGVDFDTDWFKETIPSIDEPEKFVPEWEDREDEDTVILFFLAEYAEQLLHQNSSHLCDEAKEALTKYLST